MSQEKDNKVINLFNKRSSKNAIGHKIAKDITGFEYVKLTRDNNGMMLNEESLLDYAQKCNYIIRIMRKVNSETCLYNYNVPSDKLLKFFNLIETGQLNGTIIEIEKIFSEDFA